MPHLSARVELPYLQPSQAQKHVTHNEALQRLDAVTQLTLLGFAEETPPALPVEGDVYGLGAAPTGAWAGHGGDLAYWEGLAWVFITPLEGWRAWGIAEQELRVLRAGSWQAQTELQNLTLLGVGTVADATNRLAVASDAVLLSHDGAGHQVKVNKAGVGDTASLLFQSDWTGHAEIGLAGDTALSFKVSPDGQTWHTALRADPQTGQISLAPAGLERVILSDSAMQLNVPLTGSAVTQSRTDMTTGRVLKTGDFGIGGLSLRAVSEGVDLDAIDNSIPPGQYYITSTDWPSVPGPNGTYHVRHTRRSVGGGEVQTAIRDNGANMYLRVRVTTAWSPWSLVYGQSNILGAVSQSAGVPTGGLIESGSNANGNYNKYADGRLICSRVLSAGTGAAATWPFPAAFIASPVVTGAAVAPVLSAVTLAAAPTTTAATFSARDKTDARRADGENRWISK